MIVNRALKVEETVRRAEAQGSSGAPSIEKYREFIRNKVAVSKRFGLEVKECHALLKPHQRDIVEWACQGGRRAIFAAFGLGKTMMQLEIERLILEKEKGYGLIVCPLGVRQEFKHDALLLGIDIQFIRSWEETQQANFLNTKQRIFLTNYETVREGKLDPSRFAVTSLDEAAILRSFGGTKTYREFMKAFENVKYRFVATATPDPNEYIELLAYSAYLGIMDVSAAKTRFFKRDSTKADKLTLHPHKEEEFWLWVSTWAIFLQKPSDLGYSDEGYDLPPLEVKLHEIQVEETGGGYERDGQGRMFRDAVGGLTQAAAEKRETVGERIEVMRRIILADRESEVLLEVQREGKTTLSTVLPCKQAEHRPREEKDLHAEIFDNLPAPEADNRRSRGDKSTATGPIQSGQRIPRKTKNSGENQFSKEAARETHTETPSAIWNKPGTISKTSNVAGQRLRDLRSGENWNSGEREEGEIACGRPRSQDGESAGNTLPELQLGVRSLQGQSRSLAESYSVLAYQQQWVIWCDLNAEQREIERSLEQSAISYSSIDGRASEEERETLLEDWKARNTTAFISKPTMYGAGVNLQQCNKAIFLGIGFKFNDFVQAIHRIHRFLQDQPVTIHLIFANTEKGILDILFRKWDRYKAQVKKMGELIREYGLSQKGVIEVMHRTVSCERTEVVGVGEQYQLACNDCIEEMPRIKDNSVGLVLTSIPFSTQYEYSPSFQDFGHTESNAHFFEQMDFLTPQLFRVLRPGRLAVIHVKDRIVPGGLTKLGFQTVYPLHADCITHYTRHGFGYMGMKTIVTDVVRENNQTYRLGWTEQCKDGTKMGVGMPEYLLLFRKPPTNTERSYADNPVVKSKKKYTRGRWQIDAHGFTRSNGNRPLTPDDLEGLPHPAIFKIFRKYTTEQLYDFERHVKLAEGLDEKQRLPVTFMLLQPASWSPEVWTDVARMRTLNSLQVQKGKQSHLCPMQFDIANRIIAQYTMPGETVLDPFAGIGTVPMCAVEQGRKAIGIELAKGYFLDMCAYVEAAEKKIGIPTLLDLTEETA